MSLCSLNFIQAISLQCCISTMALLRGLQDFFSPKCLGFYPPCNVEFSVVEIFVLEMFNENRQLPILQPLPYSQGQCHFLHIESSQRAYRTFVNTPVSPCEVRNVEKETSFSQRMFQDTIGWSEEAASFITSLARTKTRDTPAPLRHAATTSLIPRWTPFLIHAAMSAFAASLLFEDLTHHHNLDGEPPSLSDLLAQLPPDPTDPQPTTPTSS